MRDWVTHARLAIARVILWMAWEFVHVTLFVLCRPDHPARIYIAGGKKTARATQIDSLRHSNGPRCSSATSWKAATGAVALVALVAPETRLITSLISACSSAIV